MMFLIMYKIIAEMLILANLFTQLVHCLDGEGGEGLHGLYFSLSSDHSFLCACYVVADDYDVFVLHCSNDSGTVKELQL